MKFTDFKMDNQSVLRLTSNSPTSNQYPTVNNSQ